MAREFTRNAKALGVKIHGTFIMGLPGESRETIGETIVYTQDLDDMSALRDAFFTKVRVKAV